ncbi:MAG: YegS/Rv2252/BmrU family lipid kinase [Ruminococcaceae bacterium]|nr:YegS/Rv2252/BmrU family lipid kinase [Oscillospiraceae bacterium]
MAKRLLLILNPTSGKMAGKRHLADVVEAFVRAGYAPTVFTTTHRGHGCELAREYGGRVDLVVCLGGDGTFNEVVSGLLMAGHTTPIGYIPCGSTNDFAASIGLKKTIQEATAAIIKGEPHTFDMGSFGDRYFSYVASFGAFTQASYATSQSIKNALGHLAYVLEGMKEVTKIRSHHVAFEVDGKHIEGDYLFGAISNSTSLGGILTLSPDVVDMNDGMLEMLLVKKPRNPMELSACVTALLMKNYQSPMLEFCSGSQFRVTADAAMDWTLDGEWAKGQETLIVENLRDAIHLVC